MYWDEAGGGEAVQRYGYKLEEISVFAYQFDGSGKLVPATPHVPVVKSSVIERGNSGSPRPRVLLTVVNDVGQGPSLKLKDAAVVHTLLGTPAARASHIQDLLTLVTDADGLDIDYERLDPADREAFSAFIQELASALHERKKWLSVVVQPRTSETSVKDRSGAGVIDWEAVASAADEVKVMAYLYHWGTSEPGSIAPIESVMNLARYAQNTIPSEKLCMVLHLGGFDWPESKAGKSLEYDQAAVLSALQYKPIQEESTTQSGHFDYTENQVTHHVWIETSLGLKAKVKGLADIGVRQIHFWRLGAGDPKFWSDLVAENSPVK